jgi:hypothetical protein
LIDLEDPSAREALAKRIKSDIDAFCVAEFAEDPRTHLGASIIGHDCAAYAWSTFRWLKFEQFEGRMLRLFNRGHEEERRFIRWLVGIGFEVRDVEPSTGKQFRIIGVKGHFGGSLDSMMKAPERYQIPGDLVFLSEYKTHSDKSFKKLQKSGMQLSKPMHFRQMCSYGRAYGFQYGVYCAVNKNDDDLYFEVVKLDYSRADDLFRKAEGIILSQTRPQKIAQTATFTDCKYCDFAGICHNKEPATKNCRSCKLATPVDDGEWHCGLRSLIIPKEVISIGCNSWDSII